LKGDHFDPPFFYAKVYLPAKVKKGFSKSRKAK